MKKYEFTYEKILVGGKTLSRIRALVDIPLHNVKAGDLGGFIANEYNLSHVGSCWVGGNAKVYEFALVYGDALVTGRVKVCGDAKVGDYAEVYGRRKVEGETWLTVKTSVFGDVRVASIFKG